MWSPVRAGGVLHLVATEPLTSLLQRRKRMEKADGLNWFGPEVTCVIVVQSLLGKMYSRGTRQLQTRLRDVFNELADGG